MVALTENFKDFILDLQQPNDTMDTDLQLHAHCHHATIHPSVRSLSLAQPCTSQHDLLSRMEREFPGFVSHLFGLGCVAHLPTDTVVLDVGEAINKIYFVLNGLLTRSNL